VKHVSFDVSVGLQDHPAPADCAYRTFADYHLLSRHIALNFECLIEDKLCTTNVAFNASIDVELAR